mmetsp:Transcript_20244/g.28475  ORF Transcript_20244/g.28475 Transcript_20244/m.28475 type:complete len:141 (-) Transcript_20244:154-576(-)
MTNQAAPYLSPPPWSVRKDVLAAVYDWLCAGGAIICSDTCSNTESGQGSDNGDNRKYKLSPGDLAGCIVGVFVGGLCAGLLVGGYCRRTSEDNGRLGERPGSCCCCCCCCRDGLFQGGNQPKGRLLSLNHSADYEDPAIY